MKFSRPKPAVPASVMMGDRDLTAATASSALTGQEARLRDFCEGPMTVCGLVSRKCFRRALAKRQQRAVTA